MEHLTNYGLKIDVDDEEALEVLQEMLEGDQLLQSLEDVGKHPEFEGMLEAPITFKPTYKMLENSDSYKPKKTRTPAWTDRILFCNKTPRNLEVLEYNKLETFGSDHRYTTHLLTS